MKKQNIVLVGFRGAGKTFYGRALAKLTNLPFADLDEEIEYILGESIKSFVDKHGWQVFREKEQKVVHDFSRNFSGIIATGSSSIENSKNLQNLKKTGTFIFINPVFKEVKKYLLSQSGKNNWKRINASMPLSQEIDQMWTQRKDIYSATADLEFNPDYHEDLKISAKNLLASIPESMQIKTPEIKKILILTNKKTPVLEDLIASMKKGRIPNVSLEGVIINQKNEELNTYLKSENINYQIISTSDTDNIDDFNRNLINFGRTYQPDFIFSVDWKNEFSSIYREQFGSQTLQILHSLSITDLNIKTKDICKKLIEYNEKYAGCTFFRVTNLPPAEEMALQRKVIIDDTHEIEEIKRRIDKQIVLGMCEILEKRK